MCVWIRLFLIWFTYSFFFFFFVFYVCISVYFIYYCFFTGYFFDVLNLLRVSYSPSSLFGSYTFCFPFLFLCSSSLHRWLFFSFHFFSVTHHLKRFTCLFIYFISSVYLFNVFFGVYFNILRVLSVSHHNKKKKT